MYSLISKLSHSLSRNYLKTLLIIVVSLFVAGLVALSLYFYNQYKITKSLITTEELEQRKEIQSLVAQVGKIMELPQGELPTVAVVSDKATLVKNQPFFKSAENGDKVLIYKEAKKAIIYRPGTGKIVDVGPVNINTVDQSSPSATPSL